jgi:ribosomal protein S18 acetylase RimI-like enzyme
VCFYLRVIAEAHCRPFYSIVMIGEIWQIWRQPDNTDEQRRPMPNILTDISDAAVANAIERNGIECCLSWAQWPGMELGDDGKMAWTMTDVAFPFFNNVFGASLTDDEVDNAVEAALARARSRNVPMFWWTGPTTRPRDLGEHLLAHGFVHAFEAPAMAVELKALPDSVVASDGLVIEEVLDLDTLKTWCSVMGSVYEFPQFAAETWFDILAALDLGTRKPFRHFLASVENIPVATASLYLGAGVAGISSVATAPDHQRLGIGSALALETFREARLVGYRIGTLFSSPMAVGMYRRLGFRQLTTGNCYVWGVEDEVGPM